MFCCYVCNYQNAKEASLSHHICGSKDSAHVEYLLTQKDIAKKLFLEEKNILDLIKEHPEFQLTYKFLKRFWNELYTSDQIQQRGFRIIAKHHQTFNISKLDLEKLYCQQNLTDEEIGKIYKTRSANISYLRKQYNIATLESWKRNYDISPTLRQNSILLGMILGDGYLPKGKLAQYAHFAVTHSVIQKEYLEWLFEELKEFIPLGKIRQNTNKPHPVSGKTYESFSFETTNHPAFEALYNIFYKNKIKIIDKQYLLDNLDPLALAVWLMDDGSCSKESATIRIYTNGFTENEVLDLIDVFKIKFDITAKLIRINNKKTGKIYPIIKFNKYPSFELVKLVMPYIIPSMRYKIHPVLLKNNIKINEFSLIKNSEINITKDEWIDLNKSSTKDDIKNVISNAIINNKLELPYQKISEEDAKRDFLNLKNINVSEIFVPNSFITRYPYKYPIETDYINSCNIGNMSSNYFQQVNRFNCDSINSPSPHRNWTNKKFLNSTLNYLWSMKVEEVNNNTLRAALSMGKYIASQFRPSAAKYIYDNFSGNGRVLDFSAGWGDRLAGFYASSNTVKYVGIDPNKPVFDIYREQSEKYKEWSGLSKETVFINSPAEDVVLNEEFDLIFTSPPYFDLERYSKDSSQSWIKYKTLEDWLNKFLFKTIENFWNNNLKADGHLIINISDVYCHHKIQQICDPMNDFIMNLEGALRKDPVGLRMSKRPNSKLKEGILAEPLWIWQKTL